MADPREEVEAVIAEMREVMDEAMNADDARDRTFAFTRMWADRLDAARSTQPSEVEAVIAEMRDPQLHDVLDSGAEFLRRYGAGEASAGVDAARRLLRQAADRLDAARSTQPDGWLTAVVEVTVGGRGTDATLILNGCPVAGHSDSTGTFPTHSLVDPLLRTLVGRVDVARAACAPVLEEPSVCSTCDGGGEVVERGHSVNPGSGTLVPDPQCDVSHVCPDCDGTGERPA